MSRKSRWFLGLACAAMIVAFARAIPAIPVGRGIGDFSAGLAAALMFGALLTWKDRRAQS